jgi:L-ascorbate metabolism protein UlaG (beta-lactamase superfamily)
MNTAPQPAEPSTRRSRRFRFGCLLLVAAGLGLGSLLVVGRGNRYYQGPVTDHFDGRRFDNPWAPMRQRFSDFLKWRVTARRGPWPDSVPVETTRPPARVPGKDLQVTYVGHATVLLQTQGLNILTDPIWTDRASPVPFAGPRRVAVPGVPFDQLPPIDVVLVSHNHYDHLSLPTLKRLQEQFDPLVLTPLGNDRIIHAAIPTMRVATLDWGGSRALTDGMHIALEPMQHWSARGLGDQRDALWGAFVMVAPGGPIYFLADAGHAPNLTARFLETYGQPRFSLLPVGAYEPEWFMQYAHLTPAQAVDTFTALGSGHAMGTQHEVFPMADEAYAAPRQAVAQALARAGIPADRFRLPRVGEGFTVPPLPDHR